MYPTKTSTMDTPSPSPSPFGRIMRPSEIPPLGRVERQTQLRCKKCSYVAPEYPSHCYVPHCKLCRSEMKSVW